MTEGREEGTKRQIRKERRQGDRYSQYYAIAKMEK
jgi:hypothetical protein